MANDLSFLMYSTFDALHGRAINWHMDKPVLDL